jgi:hypothetical protein
MSQIAGVGNIGPRECRKRLMMGGAMLAGGVGIASALIFTGVDRFWRIILFFPFWMGALGFFQTKEKT